MGDRMTKAWSPDKKKARRPGRRHGPHQGRPLPLLAEQKVMPLDALCQSGTETPQWRWDVLVGEGDPLYCKSREI